MLKLTAADGLSSHEEVLLRLDQIEAVEYRDASGGRQDSVTIWFRSGNTLAISGDTHARTEKLYQQIEGAL